jgi:hypothetical protein
MRFVNVFRRTAQPIRLAVSELLKVLRIYCRSRTILFAEHGAEDGDWPWLRMYVLRRDRYRCLACHRDGDEITLHVDSIRSLSLSANGLITLCAPCHRAAQALKIAGNSVPEFLDSLWDQLRLADQLAFRGNRLTWTTRIAERQSLVEAYAKRA